MSKLVDLNELTWEQKEQVLRELFARMNGAKLNKENKPKKQASTLALEKFSKNTLDKYETDEEDQDIIMGPTVSVSTKALANAMFDNQFLNIFQFFLNKLL